LKVDAPNPVVEEANPRPYEILVGHPALGRRAFEPRRSCGSRLNAAHRFTFERLVSASEQSAVFEGADRILDRPVAIRLVRLELDAEGNGLLRERLEAIARTHNPNIAQVIFADRFGHVYRIVRELGKGGTLEGFVEQMKAIGAPLTVRLLQQAASALATAHARGVVHGNLRAGNVLLDEDFLVKLADFALEPWPVRTSSPMDSTRAIGQSCLLPREVQTDLSQFADLVDYLADHTVLPATLAEAFSGGDPVERLRVIAAQAREGRFRTLHQMHREFSELLSENAAQGEA